MLGWSSCYVWKKQSQEWWVDNGYLSECWPFPWLVMTRTVTHIRWSSNAPWHRQRHGSVSQWRFLLEITYFDFTSYAYTHNYECSINWQMQPTLWDGILRLPQYTWSMKMPLLAYCQHLFQGCIFQDDDISHVPMYKANHKSQHWEVLNTVNCNSSWWLATHENRPDLCSWITFNPQ